MRSILSIVLASLLGFVSAARSDEAESVIQPQGTLPPVVVEPQPSPMGVSSTSDAPECQCYFIAGYQFGSRAGPANGYIGGPASTIGN
jgi:hypothetical protein